MTFDKFSTMEIRDFALTVVRTEDLDVKLAPPAAELTDEAPGPAVRLEEPGRPAGLRFSRKDGDGNDSYQ